jgi:hypothetical protein
MSANNDNTGGPGTSSAADPRTDAIGGSSGADEGMSGGGGLGGTQTASTGVSADVDRPGSQERDTTDDGVDLDSDKDTDGSGF